MSDETSDGYHYVQLLTWLHFSANSYRLDSIDAVAVRIRFSNSSLFNYSWASDIWNIWLNDWWGIRWDKAWGIRLNDWWDVRECLRKYEIWVVIWNSWLNHWWGITERGMSDGIIDKMTWSTWEGMKLGMSCGISGWIIDGVSGETKLGASDWIIKGICQTNIRVQNLW